jgi:hypothetical protein
MIQVGSRVRVIGTASVGEVISDESNTEVSSPWTVEFPEGDVEYYDADELEEVRPES